MSTPWVVAFVVLAAAVALLTLVVLGLLRRILPLLERAEARAPAEQPELGARVGSIVDRFALYTRDRERVDWGDFLGVPSLLLFASEGCAACEQLLPELKDVGHAVEGVPLLVVANDPSDELVSALDDRLKVLYQPDGAAVAALDNRALPQAYFVDPSGLVLARRVPGSEDDLREMVRARERGLVETV